MRGRLATAGLTAGLMAGLGVFSCGDALASVVCPDSSSCSATFSRTFTGLYLHGQPMDVVTIAPIGVETLADAGITIHVVLRDCQGNPIVGLPATQIVVSSPALCICSGGNIADAATDSNGRTTFTGLLKVGGCARNLQVVADGIVIGTVPVKTNSPDARVTPCFADHDDLAMIAGHYGFVSGTSPSYDICFDYNKDGVIDLSDWVFAMHFHGYCFP